MSTTLKASLEMAIQEWINGECEEPDWPPAIVAPTIAARMTEAAYAVLIANFEGQEHKEREG